MNINSLQILEYKLLKCNIDKAVNDEVNQFFFKLSLNCHVILISARMTCLTIIATPDTPATIEFNNTGVIFVKILCQNINAVLKFKNYIVCKITSTTNNKFNNKCYPTPCLTLMQEINNLKIIFNVICNEYVFDNKITCGMFEFCFFDIVVFLFSLFVPEVYMFCFN